MSFLEPNSTDHAIERYRRSRVYVRRWHVAARVWLCASLVTAAMAVLVTLLAAPTVAAVVLTLLLFACGCGLVYTTSRLDTARLNLRADTVQLRSHDLNPEDYRD